MASRHVTDLWKNIAISKRVHLAMRFVDKNIQKVLSSIIKKEVEGKCLAHGYVKRNSVTIVSYSAGLLKAGDVAFDVVFTCDVCLPMHGQPLTCIVKSRSAVGIRAEVDIPGHSPAPIVVFIALDHYINQPHVLSFMKSEEAEEGKEIEVSVIGQRFQLNDNQIRVIAELNIVDTVVAADDQYEVEVGAGGRKRKVLLL